MTSLLTTANFRGDIRSQGLLSTMPGHGAARIQRMHLVNECEKLFGRARRGDLTALRDIEDFFSGRRKFRETMTSDDFASLTSELLNRRLKAQFASRSDWGWRRYVPVAPPATDFRRRIPVTVDRIDSGEDGVNEPDAPIPENSTFGFDGFVDSDFEYRMEKYIRGFKHSWELMLNDDLGGTGRFAGLMVNRLVGGLGRFITKMHADTSGPKATFYTGPNGNIVTGNPSLSQSALELAFEILGDRDGPDGEPIMLGGSVLVLGSQRLVTIAKQIQNTMFTDRADGTDVVRQTATLPDFEIVYNPYIRKVATVANDATSWWLFPAVTGIEERTWAEIAFLQGFESPNLYRKRGDVETFAGQPVPELGSFDNWSHEMALAFAYGGVEMEPIVTVASNGTNVP